MLVRTTLVLGVLFLLIAAARSAQNDADTPTTQPTTQPAESRTTLPRPEQADILRNLLGRRDLVVPVVAPRSADRPGADAGVGPDGHPLLIEGTMIVERPGRLIRDENHPRFVFHLGGDTGSPRTMELLRNQVLETMEREAEAGFTEFIISAEVTRYRGANFLLLRKVLRRTDDGNIGP